MAIKPESSTGRPANPSQPNHLLLPPGHPVLGVSSLLLLPSSSPYPVSQPVPATSTDANSAATYKACYRCRNIKPLSDFMNPRFAFVLKTCACCRQSKAESNERSVARKKARLEAELRANVSQNQAPLQGHSQAQNVVYAQMPLAPFTVVNESGLVIPGLLSQPSFTPYVPNKHLETTEVPELDVTQTQPSVASEDEDEDGEATSPLSAPSFFRCLHCEVTRSARLEYSGICVYCFEHEQKYCVIGQHEEDRPCFVGADGVEYDDCNGCRSA